MSRFFLIGASGHVGGAVLDQLVKTHPDTLIKTLIRTSEQSRQLTSKYPSVQCIIGDLDSLAVIEGACSEADIVINFAPDITHDDGIQAILRGLKKGAAGRKRYYIHTSGAYLVIDTTESGGLKDARVWDDVADIEELISMPDSVTHAVTDKMVRSAWPEINVSIIAPGIIGGVSPSISHPCPLTTEQLVQAARAMKSGFQIERGENQLGFVHVLDLAQMYMLLIDDALGSLSGSNATATTERPIPPWGPHAYYFGVTENIRFSELMRNGLVPVMFENGIIESTEVVSTSASEVARAILYGDGYDPDGPPPPPDSWALHVAAALGLNMRIVAARMAKLGWKPVQGSAVRSYDDAIPLYLRLEKENKG